MAVLHPVLDLVFSLHPTVYVAPLQSFGPHGFGEVIRLLGKAHGTLLVLLKICQECTRWTSLFPFLLPEHSCMAPEDYLKDSINNSVDHL